MGRNTFIMELVASSVHQRCKNYCGDISTKFRYKSATITVLFSLENHLIKGSVITKEGFVTLLLFSGYEKPFVVYARTI